MEFETPDGHLVALPVHRVTQAPSEFTVNSLRSLTNPLMSLLRGLLHSLINKPNTIQVARALVEFETLWQMAWSRSVEASKAGLQVASLPTLLTILIGFRIGILSPAP